MADLVTSIQIKILDAFSAPLRKMGDELGAINKRMDSMGKAFALAANLNQASQAVGNFASKIQLALKAPIDDFANFEQAMAKVAAMTNQVGTEEFGMMKEAALELGANTSYSSEQAAEAMAAFGQQGRTVNEILAITPQALALARAGMIDLGEAATIIGTAMSGMGLKAEETQRAVDVLAQTANLANTDVRGLGEAFSYIGPVAKDAHLSFEMTAAMLGKLADAGMDSNRAGTGLRAVMLRLLSPSNEATKALAKFGLSHKQINELQKNAASGKLDESLRMLGEAGAKLPDEKRLKLLADIFGQEAMSASGALISAKLDVSATGLDALYQANKNAGDSAMHTAKIMDNTLKGAFERAWGQFQTLSTKLGEEFAPSIKGATKTIEDSLTGLTTWATENKGTVTTIGKLAVVLGGAALGLQAVLVVASTIASAAGLIFGVWKGIVLFNAALAALPAILGGIATAFGLLFTGAGAILVGLVGVATGIGVAIGMIIDHFTGASAKLQSAFEWLFGNDYGEDMSSRGQNNDERTYADGTVVNTKTGKVVTLGTGNEGAPKFVRDARAAGRGADADEVNAFVLKTGGNLAGSPVDTTKAFGLESPFATSTTPPAAPGASPAAPFFESSHEEVVRMARASEENAQALKELLEEVRKNARRTSPDHSYSFSGLF